MALESNHITNAETQQSRNEPSGVLYHHSSNLFNEFDISKTCSDNGSGLWANTGFNAFFSNATQIEYSFTAPGINLIRPGHTMDEDGYIRLLQAAEELEYTDLVSSMKKHGQEKFKPYDHGGRDLFVNSYKDALKKSGFDGIVTGANTVCLITLDKVTEFHVVQAKGSFEARINELMSRLEGLYPSPEEELLDRASYQTFIPALRAHDDITEIIDNFSTENPKLLSDEVSMEIKSCIGRLILAELDGESIDNFNCLRLFLYTVDQHISSAMFYQGASFNVMNPYDESYMKSVAPEKGSIGDLKVALRRSLDNAIPTIDSLAQTNAPTPETKIGTKQLKIKGRVWLKANS